MGWSTQVPPMWVALTTLALIGLIAVWVSSKPKKKGLEVVLKLAGVLCLSASACVGVNIWRQLGVNPSQTVWMFIWFGLIIALTIGYIQSKRKGMQQVSMLFALVLLVVIGALSLPAVGQAITTIIDFFGELFGFTASKLPQ